MPIEEDTRLILTEDETLFFINSYDGSIYSLEDNFNRVI